MLVKFIIIFIISVLLQNLFTGKQSAFNCCSHSAITSQICPNKVSGKHESLFCVWHSYVFNKMFRSVTWILLSCSVYSTLFKHAPEGTTFVVYNFGETIYDSSKTTNLMLFFMEQKKFTRSYFDNGNEKYFWHNTQSFIRIGFSVFRISTKQYIYFNWVLLHFGVRVYIMRYQP